MIDLGIVMQLIGLAVVDAINPCELAVMAMVLAAVLLNNPEKRRNILLAGLAFTSAVFIGYFIYGIVIVNFFKYLIPETSIFSLYVFKGFGVLAIILGLLNIKDYLFYRPGGVATEMPLSFRPRVKLLISRITSPLGAFFIGLFVTVFLLPCTMGPYFIFSGIIKDFTLMEASFLLILYNLIFVIPMIILTLVIYLGATSVEKVSGWKEKNIKKLHLLEGIILIILGILMVTGVI